MPINNINTLIDQSQLAYFGDKYFNEALANLGQRNIDDKQLKFVLYTVKDLINDVYKFITGNDEVPLLPNHYLVLKNSTNGKILFGDENSTTYDFNITESNTTKSIILSTKIKILTQLFVEITNDIEEKQNNIDSIDLSNTYSLYFPLDYEFEYISDGINESNIFGSARDIYISIIPNSIDDFNFIKTPFILNDQSFIRTKIYSYVFDYNDFNYNVDYNLEYVLPYIKNNNWYINDIDSQIQAKSQDAMNLNIILAESDVNRRKVNILSGLNQSLYQNLDLVEIVGGVDDSNYKVYCKIADVNNNSDIIFNIVVCLPKIELESSDINIHIDSLNDINKILANSTLIVISKVNDCVIEEENNEDKKKQILEELGQNGIITTLWQYNIENQRFEYISIETDKDGNNIALDLTTMSNFINLINSSLSKYKQLEPDNFLFTQLLFDPADSPIKHTSNSNKKLNYPTFLNVQGSNYSPYYINNFNFVLKYISNIEKDGEVITRISNNNISKYLNFNQSFNSVTNKLYSKTLGNIIDAYNEWLPNYNVPLFDLSEVLIKDSNVLNRQNILTFDAIGNIYYSYIGSSFDTSQDKNILHIGSSNTNINLGNETMLSTADMDKFQKQNEIDIDFDRIDLNGDVNIKKDLNIENSVNFNKQSWTITEDERSGKVKITSIIPKYKYIPYYNNGSNNSVNTALFYILDITNLETNILNITPPSNKDYLYVNIILRYTLNNNNYYYKHGDLLYIPNLLLYLDLPSNTKVISSSNDIIRINGESKYICTNNNELSKFINITVDNVNNDSDITITFKNDDENIDYTSISSSNWFIANQLELAYFEKYNTLVVNEIKTNKIQSIWKLPTNITT